MVRLEMGIAMRFLVQCFFLLSMLGLVTTIGVGEDVHSAAKAGSFVALRQADGTSFRAFVAGPAQAKTAVLVVHDYFGISDATRESVKRLGALGYRVAAVDLYGGKSATVHEDAVELMQSLDRGATDKILQAGLDYLKQQGRKVATIGFSMGGLESLNGALNDPDAVSASVIIYGFGFDKIETRRLERLRGPVLVITGGEDTGAVQAAIDFLSNMKEAKRSYEMLIYPGAGHGYAQPLFNQGKNYNPEAVRTTWVLIENFLQTHLK